MANPGTAKHIPDSGNYSSSEGIHCFKALTWNWGLIHKIGLLCILLPLVQLAQADENRLTVSYLAADQSQTETNLEFIRGFQDLYPNIVIKPIGFQDKEYKNNIHSLLKSGDVDVFYWQAGKRLCALQEQGLLEPVDEVWESVKLSRVFADPIMSLISCERRKYAVPFAYYQWGFFYNKDVFRKLGISAPRNWDNFLTAAKVLAQNGITPIGIAAKNKWPVAAWFDYVNLRINGLQFYTALLDGKERYTDPRVANALNHWKELLDLGYVMEEYDDVDTTTILPFLFNGDIGMILSGNFTATRIPPGIKKSIAFFRFPIINPEIAQFEVAPTELFAVSKNSRNKAMAKKFLEYLSYQYNQEFLAQRLNYLSPHADAKTKHDYFYRAGIQTLRSAKGYSQYFDRDIDPEISADAIAVLSQFLHHRNIDQATTALETLRLKVHGEITQ